MQLKYSSAACDTGTRKQPLTRVVVLTGVTATDWMSLLKLAKSICIRAINAMISAASRAGQEPLLSGVTTHCTWKLSLVEAGAGGGGDSEGGGDNCSGGGGESATGGGGGEEAGAGQLMICSMVAKSLEAQPPLPPLLLVGS